MNLTLGRKREDFLQRGTNKIASQLPYVAIILVLFVLYSELCLQELVNSCESNEN